MTDCDNYRKLLKSTEYLPKTERPKTNYNPVPNVTETRNPEPYKTLNLTLNPIT